MNKNYSLIAGWTVVLSKQPESLLNVLTTHDDRPHTPFHNWSGNKKNIQNMIFFLSGLSTFYITNFISLFINTNICADGLPV